MGLCLGSYGVPRGGGFLISEIPHTTDCKGVWLITQKWIIHRPNGREYRRDIGRFFFFFITLQPSVE